MIEELARKDGITREQFVSESGDINADLFEVLDKYHPSVGIWGMIVMLATMSCRYDARLSDVLAEVKSAYFLETEKMLTLYARGAYGRKANQKDWEAGKDFQCQATGRYFSVRDLEFIRSKGVIQILFAANADWNRPVFIVRLDNA